MKKSARKKKHDEPYMGSDRPKIVAEVEPRIEKKSMRKFFSNKSLVIGVFVVLLIIIAAGGIYAISYFAEDAKFEQTPEDTQKILSELGKVYLLPEGETPTVATVTDVEKLSNQPFFANAQNGDKVILFGGIKQAILYRPSIKKIVNMSPIDPNSIPQTDESTATPSASTDLEITPTPEEKVKVAVLNSTQEVGLARKGADLLDEDQFEIVGSLNANGEYESTFVSVINRANVSTSAIDQIVQSMGRVEVKNQSLPSNEAAPAGADAVVILGSDFSEAY